MKKKLSIEKEEHIHSVAHFLLINSEAIRDSYLDGNMSLIYFFFKYSKVFKKEDYALFGFEHLEAVLIHTLSKIDKNKYGSYSGLAEIGWSLIKFVEEGYFESDDLEEILAMIDKVVFSEVEMLSRTNFKLIYLPQLLFLGLYLEERSNLSTNSGEHFLESKEYLLICFFELEINIKKIPIENKELLKLCKLFYKNGTTNAIISHFYIKGLKTIEELLPSNDDDKVEYNLIPTLEIEAIEIIENLYKKGNLTEDRAVKKLISLGIKMINFKEMNVIKSFDSYLEGFSLNPRNNA